MKIAIQGVASSKFGELWDMSPRALAVATVKKALVDAAVSLKEIDALYVGNMLSGILGNQENLGAFFAEEIGFTGPAIHIEAACASGGLAVHQASLAISSGLYQRVLVLGVEKMTDHKPEEVAAALMGAGSEEERVAGLTFPGLYALIARAYMETYGISEKELAKVGVKNHFHGSFNPNAHFSGGAGSRSAGHITVEQVMKSPYIADPLKLLDCSPISDGASAAVLAGEKNARQKGKKPVWIAGSSVASDTLSVFKRKTLTSLSTTKQAARIAYEQAGVTPADITVAEVHDCFSIAELLALEDLGFFKPGESGHHIEELTLEKSKKLVVNTSGGLKACGHPVGATGVKQIIEIVEQLRGTAGKRQVEHARIGLTHNVGGSGAVAVVHVLTI